MSEVVLSYLEKKSNKLTNFENLEDLLPQSPPLTSDYMSLIVVVGNYERAFETLEAVH